jgi:1,4-dihydroxy-6-naphthoate synthase
MFPVNKNLSLGFSPCPNDTFIFYGLVHGLIDSAGVKFAKPILEDVEKLNLWAMAKTLDVTKLSFHALGHVLDEYCLLSAGSALGRGCGPLLVSGSMMPLDDLEHRKIAIPGKLTTAAMLLQMFLPDCHQLVEMRFDRIMGAIRTGEVDAGVIIHESRFTYGDQGLFCLQDLGEWWEQSTGLPIPLGCIAARRNLGRDRILAIDQAIKNSVAYAFDHQDDCLPYIRSKSQELEPKIVRSHIELYVNEFSRDLGEEGKAAVNVFMDRGRQAGVLPENVLELMI